MSDKLQPPAGNTAPSWTFQTGFRGTDHTFNYDEQNRQSEASQQEFDVGDSSRQHQQATPRTQHFLPRIGLPFPDFTDYQRFNEFQRNAFLTAPFGSQFSTPTYPFPLNTSVPTMDSFNFTHTNPLLPNSFPPLHPPAKPKTTAGTLNDLNEKPPVLSVQFPVKQESDLKFEQVAEFPVIPKEEPADEMAARDALEKKKVVNGFPPPHLASGHPFETNRICDDVLVFNPPFHQQPIDMGIGVAFKQELATPPIRDVHEFTKFNTSLNGKPSEIPQTTTLHDCQVCLSTHANGLHFGARTCAACAAFFRRTISDDKTYVCKRNQRCTNASRDGTGYRKICRSCRMKRCLEIGMLPENVQHKRTRNETGTPPRKATFDNFFHGFYSPFPTSATSIAPIAPINFSSTDTHHSTI